MTIGADLAETTAGIDLLYRAATGAGSVLNAEGLIPVAVARVKQRELRDWAEADAALDVLLERIGRENEDPLRAGWLTEMALSLKSLVAMFSGRRIGFAQRLADQLRVDPHPVSEQRLDVERAKLRAALDEMGYRSNDLAEDVGAWETDRTVPTDQVLAVLADYQAEARRRCEALVLDIGDDWLKPEGVTERPYAAYCDYPGRRVWLNLDFRYTHSDLKHLATHEAFPGHLVHLARREALVREGNMPLEGAQVVTCSASSALFEGIADNGIELLQWDETPEDAAGLALQRIRSALRCNASWMVCENGKSLDEAVEATAGPAFQDHLTTRRRLDFVKHELRAPFLFAYWCGDEAVRIFRERARDADRRFVVETLFDQMHTPKTLLAALPRDLAQGV